MAPEPASGNSFLGDTYASFWRYIRKNFRHPHTVGFALMQPVLFLVLFSEVFGDIAHSVIPFEGGYITFILPAIVIQVALLSASASGVWLVNDLNTGMMGKMLASPMRRSALFLGKTLAETAFMAVQMLLLIIVGLFMGAEIVSVVPGISGVLLVGIVFSLWFVALANIFAAVSGTVEGTVLVVNFLQLPLLFLSSAFLPVWKMPQWIQYIAVVNPVTYGVNAARTLMTQGWTPELLVPVTVLLVLDGVFCAAGVYVLADITSDDT